MVSGNDWRQVVDTLPQRKSLKSKRPNWNTKVRNILSVIRDIKLDYDRHAVTLPGSYPGFSEFFIININDIFYASGVHIF